MNDKGKGNDGGILGAIGGLFNACADEAGSLWSSSGSNSPSPDASGSGTHTDSSGGPSGSSSAGSFGITERHDNWGNSISHTDSAGRQYAGGMMGWIDSLTGTNSNGHSVQNGNRTEHYDNSDNLQAVSLRQADGSELTYDTDGRFIGAFTPDRIVLDPSEAEDEGYSSVDVDIDDLLNDDDDDSYDTDAEKTRGYVEGFSAGWDDGHLSSRTDWDYDEYTAEYAEGHQEGYEESLQRAWDEGDTDGYIGYEAQYEGESYLEGHAEGWERARAEGYTDGYNGSDAVCSDAAYIEGYDKGWADDVAAGYEDGMEGVEKRYSDPGYLEGYEKAEAELAEEEQAEADAEYNRGHGHGRSAGYEDGLKNKTNSFNYEDCSSNYTEGHKDGYTEGLSEGLSSYNASYRKGFDKARPIGYVDGRAGETSTFTYDGCSCGYTQGHKDGYGEGHEEGWAEDDPHLTMEEIYCGPTTDSKRIRW